MRDRLPIPKDLLALIDGAARYDRGPALRKSVLQAARHSIMQGSLPSNEHPLWGWKQPNTHVLVPLLAQCIPQMKYIYMVGNGLDLGFSYNQSQLNRFLNLELHRETLQTIARSIVIPDSTGRYRDQDCRQLCSVDVEFARTLGFEVPSVF